MAENKESGIDLILALDKKIKEIRTDSLDLSFGELANMYENEELVIEPDYQRLFRWSKAKQSRFIESILLGLPIPPIFMIERNDGVLELIDGLQRISSYLHFTREFPSSLEGDNSSGQLRLEDCDIFPNLNKKTYRELPTAIQLKLKRRYIRVEIIKKESDQRLRYHMFKRLNTGGENLSDQEVRNCTIRLLDDRFNKFLIDMSNNEDFEFCISTLTEEKKLQKYDQELVLRFFTFRNRGDQFRHDIADFMTDYMEAISDPEKKEISFDYNKERSVFEKTFRVLRETLGEYAFSRVNERGNYVLGFIVYHYEAFTLGIQEHLNKIDLNSPDQIGRIAEELASIKRDPQFREITTGGGRNTKKYLDDRIAFVEERIGKII